MIINNNICYKNQINVALLTCTVLMTSLVQAEAVLDLAQAEEQHAVEKSNQNDFDSMPDGIKQAMERARSEHMYEMMVDRVGKHPTMSPEEKQQIIAEIEAAHEAGRLEEYLNDKAQAEKKMKAEQ